jgi:hypothetical protein
VRRAAVGAFQRVGERADRDRRGEAGGIDLAGSGREEHVHARGLGDPLVPGLVARIGLEVRGLVELRRVHEEGHHDDVGPPGGAHERLVPCVEGAHGGHESHRGAGFPVGGQDLAQARDRAHELHAAARSRVARASSS